MPDPPVALSKPLLLEADRYSARGISRVHRLLLCLLLCLGFAVILCRVQDARIVGRQQLLVQNPAITAVNRIRTLCSEKRPTSSHRFRPQDFMTRSAGIALALALSFAAWLPTPEVSPSFTASSWSEASTTASSLLPGQARAFAEAEAWAGEKVNGFAEYARKKANEGQMPMKADPSCFVTSCGKETRTCFAENQRCLKGALCLARCRGEADCATACFADYGCPDLDSWLECTVETKQCVSIPRAAYDVESFYQSNAPKKLETYDVQRLEGSWYKVRGYNSKYDCYLCQTNVFKYDSAANMMEQDVTFRIPGRESVGYIPQKLTEKMQVGALADRATLLAKGNLFGLSFQEEWYILNADDDFVLVAYTGHNLQDVYQGSFVFARTPELSPDVENKARLAALNNGYDWDKYCIIDNACPSQDPSDNQISVKFGLDDLPDLVEWFIPGSTRRPR